MQAAGLIDTGPLLALLDRNDRWHTRCAETFRELRYPLATTSAVLAEFFHLLGSNPRDVANAWSFIRSGAITVLPITDADTPHLEQLMERYADRPMDLADATLVRLAERESLTLVFTIDYSDFETYRIKGKSCFRIVPAR